MFTATLYHTYKRMRTLRTHRISAMPIVILMPHSACNCRCVMCDIWKDNKNLKQLTVEDVKGLLSSLKDLGTQQVLMSGGEALLNSNFFQLCKLLRNEGMGIILLSTGLSVRQHAHDIVENVDELIVSLDGHETLHDEIRNIPNAYKKLMEGISAIRAINPTFRITSRTVIHRLNFRHWMEIVYAARELGIDQVSFLPVDVSSHAFNREVLWSDLRQQEILVRESELAELRSIIEELIQWSKKNSGFLAESPDKLRNIAQYYSAFYGLNLFPYKKCNAPWVSVVVEADGSVRPCFFHPVNGNIRTEALKDIINSEESIRFRRQLDMTSNPTCVKCVCSLNLSPGKKLN